MERAVYFHGWQRRTACQHPSMPMRTLDMVEDLKKYHATILVWSAAGGGSISLPYLERELNAIPDPKLRIYGYLNEKEYIAECHKYGIDPFAIVYEVQNWEFPTKYDENGKIIGMNMSGEDGNDWYGLREFTDRSHDAAFPTTLDDYYPNGIYNTAGELVTDLHEEAAARDQYGVAIHARWVEVEGRRAECYQACRNNPVWRDYLKKIVYLQAKAGARGIQLDECELPMTSMGSGGCFCRDCMMQFTEYLKKCRDEGKLSSEWDGIDVDNFNYRDYLNERGIKFNKQAPFYREYWEFQVRAVKCYFSELADYVHSLSDVVGEPMRVSGNFYNLAPLNYPIQPKVDVVITEMAHTLLHQPYFFRYAAGFGGGKPVLVVENPYGGIIPELLEMMDRGRGYDLYRVFMMEASVFGCNMGVPHGGWMGNVIHDGFQAPHWLNCEIQDYIYNNEKYFTDRTDGAALVIYSYKSNYWTESFGQVGGGNVAAKDANPSIASQLDGSYDDTSRFLDFWQVIKKLSAKNVQYDVKMTPDGDLRDDDFSDADLAGYKNIVLPDCNELTENQIEVFERFAKNGGKLIVHERICERERFAAAGAIFSEGDGFMDVFMPEYEKSRKITCSSSEPGLGYRRCDGEGFAAVHIINYNYSMETDCTEPAKNVTFELEGNFSSAHIICADGESELEIVKTATGVKVTLDIEKVYSMIVFEM